MEKKLYYQFSDGCQFDQVVMSLEECKNTIESDMNDCNEDDVRCYLIAPIWLTDDEFEKLPEACI